MKIGLISSSVPLVKGGYRVIVDGLQEKLQEHGHQVESIYIPTTDDPHTTLVQLMTFRLLYLDENFDRVITFRPPAHVVRHSTKVVWFIHHLRIFYDLWDTQYRPVPDTAGWRSVRATLIEADSLALREAHKVFTNSRVVGERLRRFNRVDSEVLYPPVLHSDMFAAGPYGDEIVCICRMESHKRQHLLVEAMRHVKTGVKLRLCGETMNTRYVGTIHENVRAWGLSNRVLIENRWISNAEKVERLSKALAAAYVAWDEDSYGYPTIEAAHARKCTVTLSDAGGVLEFVQDGVTGCVAEPTPWAIAQCFDRLYTSRKLARQLGEAAEEQLKTLRIDWEHVVARLLS